MTTPAVSTTSNSNSRWARSGEPGSAFGGPTRPGRGARGRGGHRGGRGGRGSVSGRESMLDIESRSPKPASSPAPATTPPIQQAPSTSIEKSSMPVPPSPKPKPPSRRTSRPIPPSVNTQVPATEVASAPASARPSNRRKRLSQGSKSITIPPKIAPPATNDNLSRPNKPRLAPVPHTAPIKDTPPHLNNRFDMRHDIDALVERVRAVAMDNRPSTPGSHIDWAGDDDDSLPDLDDWGVNPATFAATKSEVISPIILEGLRPLPDISTSITSSPLRQVVTLVEHPAAKESNVQAQNGVSTTPDKATPKVETKKEILVSEQRGPSEPPIGEASVRSTSSARRPLHPSLPAKPMATGTTSHPSVRSVARSPIHPQTPGSDDKETLPKKASNPDISEQAIERSATAMSSAQVKALFIIDSAPMETEGSTGVTLVGSKDVTYTPIDTSKTTADAEDSEVEGLAASMHAPKAMPDSISAPANMSAYSDLPSVPRSGSLTHTRAQTVGRPPSFPRSANGDYNSRFPRPAHLNGRGGSQSGYHSRTHSSPPAVFNPNQHRSQASRPVITGDAISRLARTIGKPTNVSPKHRTLATLGD